MRDNNSLPIKRNDYNSYFVIKNGAIRELYDFYRFYNPWSLCYQIYSSSWVVKGETHVDQSGKGACLKPGL